MIGETLRLTATTEVVGGKPRFTMAAPNFGGILRLTVAATAVFGGNLHLSDLVMKALLAWVSAKLYLDFQYSGHKRTPSKRH